MEINKTTNTVLKRPLIEIREEGTLVITEEFLNQLKYVCSKISEVEWSGLIFFTTEGEPQDLSTFKVTPYYIHLMDKGTSGYTEFDDDGSAKELYEAMPELDPFEGNGYRYGKIHSHNTMQVFHSGTDVQDLQDQAGAYQEYYLSVIVNNFMDIEAKMAFVAEIPDQSITPKGFKGMDWKLPKKDVLVTVDFDVEMGGADLTIPEALKDRLEEISVYKVPAYDNIHGGYYGGHCNRGGGQNMLPSHNLGHGIDDTIDDNLGYEDTDMEEYRNTQAKIALRNFFHDCFDKKVEMSKVFEEVCNLSPMEVNDIQKETVTWFEKLSDWQKQNVVMYISDVEIKKGEENLEQVYEAIWESVKLTD